MSILTKFLRSGTPPKSASEKASALLESRDLLLTAAPQLADQSLKQLEDKVAAIRAAAQKAQAMAMTPPPGGFDMDLRAPGSLERMEAEFAAVKAKRRALGKKLAAPQAISETPVAMSQPDYDRLHAAHEGARQKTREFDALERSAQVSRLLAKHEAKKAAKAAAAAKADPHTALLQKFASLKGGEATSFYREHKRGLRVAQNVVASRNNNS